MTAKVYYLSTCDTCKKILKEVKLSSANADMVDIKSQPLTGSETDQLAQLSGSYSSLINKRATLYKERKLSEQVLTEEDCRNLLLEHYTFLKRPVVIVNGEIFTGNDKTTVAALKEAAEKL